ncbi:hypothetical protein [uncultured Legionella sp.]|uniref:hypothetical protein n=1 Tax=uncultured Legionella sp. TaxID=210934 RepID=UPI002611BA60|nr:hypothetical protein [uncultured Legionella sp.]
MNNNGVFRGSIWAAALVGLLGCANQSVPVATDSAHPRMQKTNGYDQVDLESGIAKSPILISAPGPAPSSPTAGELSPALSLPVETPDVE